MKRMNVNDFGKFLVEDCLRIDMKEFLKLSKRKLKRMLLEMELKVDEIEVEVVTSTTGNGGVRYWFLCPISGKKCSVIFRHPVTGELGSREALGLKYMKNVKKGMIENNLFANL